MPVSYTHLDVYKRQAKRPMRNSEKNSYHIGDIQPVMSFVNGAMKYTTISPATPNPTEDVYKRQLFILYYNLIFLGLFSL